MYGAKIDRQEESEKARTKLNTLEYVVILSKRVLIHMTLILDRVHFVA